MRAMAIDYGDAHTGVAVSDLTGLLAGYTETIHTRRPEEVLRRLGELAQEYAVTELVLGYPKNMDGTLGERAGNAGAAVGRAAHHHRGPRHSGGSRTPGQGAEENRGRCGGGADSGGVSDLPARRKALI